MMRYGTKVAAFLIMTGSVLTLAACDMNQPTYVSPHRAQVEQSRYDAEVPVNSVDDGFYHALAQEYKSSGGGQLYITFVYNPESGGSAALAASELAGRATKTMRGYGISDVKADIMPVADSAHSGKVLISYTKYAATAPKDCKTMPGLEDTQVELGWDYQYGCSLESQIAKQVARPRDLLGTDEEPETSSGRRAAGVAAPYHAAVPNKPLEIDSITDQEN